METSTTGGASASSAAASSSSGPSTSASASGSAAGATHYLAKRVLRGSAVLHVAEGCFRSPDSADVVLAKETSLELVAVGDDGVLQSICEQDMFGIVKDIGVLQWHSRHIGLIPQIEHKDLLVVLSDSGKLSLLYFCPEMHRFFAIANIELSKPGNLRHQLGRVLAIDRDVRGTIWNMRFISTSQDEEYYPVLAMIINRKGSDVNDLSLFGHDSSSGVINHISSYSEIGPLALDISEIPEMFGFALLFRVGDALLLDLRNPRNVCCVRRISLTTSLIGEPVTVEDSCSVLDVDDDVAACALLELRDSANNILKDDGYMDIDGVDSRGSVKSRIVCSWSWEPPDPIKQGWARLLFCLDDGEFHILEFTADVEGVKLCTFEYIDRSLPCKPLLWMKNRMIIGFVEMGDGIIFKLGHRRLFHKSTIQNVAPILDLAIADYHGEKQDQMFACCGMCPEGSLRVLRNGVNVEKLLRTEAIYQGVTGLWTLRMKITDAYHSFLVLSFVEETRILSVGISFNDISDAVGFQPDVCTLACGLVADGLLVQIHSKGVKLCLPTVYAHPEGAHFTSPICTNWYPDVTISVGAVGHNVVVVATSNPCCLYVLGVRSSSSYQYELYETQHVQLQFEVSCISIPQEDWRPDNVTLSGGERDDFCNNPLAKVNIRKFAVIGTHKPSVEIISVEPGEALRLLTIGTISVSNALGAPISGCIPENVRFVAAERFYILAGLRNGMLLRFESEASEHYFPGSFYKDSSIPSVDTFLQLISIRRIGITPVFLVPIHDSANADIIVLSDRPWLLHAARHSLAYSSISFLPASHVTPVSSADCPNGLLFVAESCLHLVEMVHGKRLNAQKFSIGGTPRKVLYHNESRTLLVLRTGLSGASCSSDIVQVDPQNGVLLSRYKCEPGETAKCMQITKIGSDQVLIVGTSRSAGRPMMSNGEAESSTKGRLIILSLEAVESPRESSSFIPTSSFNPSSHSGSPFHEIIGYTTEEFSSNSLCSSPDEFCCNQIQAEQMAGHLRSLTHASLSGAVLAVYPYLDRYVLAAAGNTIYVFGFANENPHRMKKCAVGRTRFTITCLKTFASRIAVGDCRDGVLFYSYNESLRKLELIYSDPAQRLVGDIALLNCETAVVSDRRGSISVLSSARLEESPQKNLAVNCSFYMGETAMSIQKAAFRYRLPIDDDTDPVLETAYDCIVASTLLGSLFVMIPLTSEEHQLLQDVQERLAVHPLTAPVLGNDHAEFRQRSIPSGVPPILDGDMLVLFLELTGEQQQAILSHALPGKGPRAPVSVFQVLRTLERVHYALN
uniref:DNA damage-binding protein 1 n=1 Tax=Setaria italica TaxID=4555 RepID=K3ZQ29_SETIT